jgi:hypothetical protein
MVCSFRPSSYELDGQIFCVPEGGKAHSKRKDSYKSWGRQRLGHVVHNNAHEIKTNFKRFFHALVMVNFATEFPHHVSLMDKFKGEPYNPKGEFTSRTPFQRTIGNRKNNQPKATRSVKIFLNKIWTELSHLVLFFLN